MRRVLLPVLTFVALLGAAVPACAAPRLFALTAQSPPRLVSFDADTPGTLKSSVPVTGAGAGETIRAIDVRPATNAFVVLTTDAAGTGRISVLDPVTGALSSGVTLAPDPADLSDPYTVLSAGMGIAIDFNPVADRLRIVTGTGQNLRVNPASGLVTTDGALNPGAPQILAAAYTNSFSGATATTLYDFEAVAKTISIQNPPNNGTLVVVGPLGLAPDAGTPVGFEIAADDPLLGYLGARAAGVGQLARVNLTTGAGTLVGRIGDGTPITDLTSVEDAVSFAATDVPVAEATGAATLTLRRAGNRSGSTTVGFTTSDGTAKAGTDYVATTSSVTFGPGEVTKTIDVPLVRDAGGAPPRAFAVTLTSAAAAPAANARVVAPFQAQVTVSDPDGDGDGIDDGSDNCPNVPNADQANGDGDAVGTACDLSEVKPVTLPGPVVTLPAPVARDTTPPTLLVTAKALTRAKLRSAGLPLQFSCSEACTTVSTLLLGKAKAGTATRKLTAAGLGRVTVKLTKKGRAALGKRRSLVVSTVATDTAGLKRTFRLTVSVR